MSAASAVSAAVAGTFLLRVRADDGATDGVGFALAVREIAHRLGRTEKAVEAILYRARSSFRAAYERAQRAER